MGNKLKNKIFIEYLPEGYFLKYDPNILETFKHDYSWPENCSFSDVLDILIKTPKKFYKRGVDFFISERFPSKIPLLEDETIKEMIYSLQEISK